MALQITGIVEEVGQQIDRTSNSGNSFSTRTITLNTSRHDPYTGDMVFENHPQLEFMGDKCALLDGYKRGDLAVVTFEVVGSFVPDKTTGEMKNFTRLRAYKIEMKQRRQPGAAYPQAAGQPAPQGAAQQPTQQPQLGQTYYQKPRQPQQPQPQQPQQPLPW